MKKFFILTGLFLIISLALFCTNSLIYSADVPQPASVNFSFASDTYHQGPTFIGSGKTISCKSPVIDLMLDLNSDSTGGLVTFISQLNLEATISRHQVFHIGSQWLHMWIVSANMTFYHLNVAANPPLLNIYFQQGLLTSWSPSDTKIGDTMTLQDSESADSSIKMTPQTLLNGIGISDTQLRYSEDLAFTFTNIRIPKNPGGLVSIDKEGNFIDEWRAEGSFSASARGEKPVL